MYHIFVECIGSTRSTHLRQKLKDAYHKYQSVTTPSEDYTTVESLYVLFDDETETIRQPGWERVSTDKLERKTTCDTGPSIYINPYSTKPREQTGSWKGFASRAHCCPHSRAQNQFKTRSSWTHTPTSLFTTTPMDSLNHHLLNNLASYLGSTLIIDPNPLNPLLTTNYLTPEQYLEHPVETQSPIILTLTMLRNNTTLWKILTATAHLPRLLVFSSRQRAMQIVKRIQPNLIMTAPSGSITTIPKWFWYGTRRLLPTKNTFLEGN
jgi:hypothetical protein